MSKILALWAAPRSASTAFEIMMQERGDFQVYHEPFGVSYYNSERRETGREAEGELQAEQNSDVVWQRLREHATKQPVFVKDLANHISSLVDEGFVSHFTNTFIIRDPAKALPSLFKLWPDFTLQEASCTELFQLFELAQSVSGETPVVIDADDLIADPERIIKSYCEAVDIPFIPEALSWEAKPRSNLIYWDGGSWHNSVLQTTGFEQQKKASNHPRIEDHPHLQEAYEVCLPCYEKLYEQRIR